MKSNILNKCLFISMAFLFPISGFADDKAGEVINWKVMSSGGIKCTTTNYNLMGSVAQTVVGNSSSTNYDLVHGYWQKFDKQSCCLLRGDIYEPKDGKMLINDVVFLIDYLFRGGPAPTCWEEGDCAVPLDENVLINDAVWMVDDLFRGGPAPPDC